MSLFAKKSENTAVSVKRKRKWPYVLVVLVLAGAAAFVWTQKNSRDAALTLSPTDTALLVRGDLQDNISATGTVESAKSMTVYSTMAYTVQEVLVKVGDTVEEGQLLCKLDDSKIRDQIETQQASMNASNASTNAAINSARDNYEQFKASLENGMNASIISAENAVTNTYNAYLTAQENYDRYVEGLEKGENATIMAQETAVRNARNALQAAYEALDSARFAVDDAAQAQVDAEDAVDQAEIALAESETAIAELQEELDTSQRRIDALEDQISELEDMLDWTSDILERAELTEDLSSARSMLNEREGEYLALQLQIAQLESSRSVAAAAVTQTEAAKTQADNAYEMALKQVEACATNLSNAEKTYDTTLKQYESALVTADNALADYAKNVENAFSAYENAQTSLEAAKTSAQTQLQIYKNNLDSAYASAGKDTLEVTLRQLQAELEKAEITAPMTGTVTAVYAEVGAAGTGLLFVIEDTDNFVIATSVKDYDIASVAVGTTATIRSDATGDDQYEGQVTYIAPTANKNAMGVTDTSGDISFDTDVAVTSPDTKLRIGLNVRLNFVVAEEKDALSAPYDAIYTNGQGQTCIMTAEEQADGTWLLYEIPVETGLETDLDIAVKGDGLTEGMTVICDAEQHTQYIGQSILIGTDADQGLFGGF